ncbi:MAG: zinc ribbon domain-containing protein [Anaerolineaceae bacterium]|nr:zinc ribbon domain-containing protein [Anaerolineaceae bacterium]
MEIGSFIIQFALLLIVIMIVSRPFFEVPYRGVRSMDAVSFSKSERKKITVLITHQEQLAERENELENDYQLGKIPEDYYKYAIGIILEEKAEVMHWIEKLQNDAILKNGNELFHLEREEEKHIELMISEHRKKRNEKVIGFCSKCGKPVQKSDQFCARCGTQL